MKLLAFLVPPLLLAACASTPTPYNPVNDVRYSALGADPYWQVTIGDDRIVLRHAGDPQSATTPADSVWPRTLPRIVDGTTTWQSQGPAGAIEIEARAQTCTSGGRRSATP
jgi:hypothetical protein